jgi:hypothetical protein
MSRRRNWPEVFEPDKVHQLTADPTIEKLDAHWYAGK